MEKIRLVLDTNIVISSLINKNSIIRDILLSDKIVLFIPEFTIHEIEKNKDIIIKKSGLSEIELIFTLNYLLKRVKIVKKDFFRKELKEARQIMHNIDPYDSEFLALAIALNCDGIFSNDRAFEKTKIKRWTVNDIIKSLRENTD